MPNDIKAGLSAVAALVALAFAYYEWSWGQAGLAWVVLGTGAFMIVSMWVFPEATAKKEDRRADRQGS